MPRENEAEVLEYCNGLRKEYGIGEPLPEMPPDYHGTDRHGITQHCPVAVALETPCGYHTVTFKTQDGQKTVEFPEFVTDFISEHDRRYLG